MNYQNIYIGQAELVTPFGHGLDQNFQAIMRGDEAYKAFPKERFGLDFPVSAAGFIPNDFYKERKKTCSRTDFLLDFLLKSFKKKTSKRKFSSMLLLYANVDVFPVLEMSLPYEFLLQTAEDSISKILEENQIQIDKKNIHIIDNTCTTGLTLMTFAAQGIAQGLWEDVLVCAIDLIVPNEAYLLEGLGAFAKGVEGQAARSRPFDMKRNGFIKTESASLAVVTSERSSLGNECLMKLKSFNQNNDGFKLTDGRDDVLFIKETIKRVLKGAGVNESDLAFIKAHGTATKLNDEHEAKAINDIFPGALIPVTSLKGHLGHTTDASGLVENLIAGYALQKKIILPTKNCDQLAFELNIVKEPMREVKSKLFLSNSFGFGGNNASAIFEVV